MAETRTGWANRIIGHGEEDPEQLLANPRNWRIHPKPQQDALAKVLDTVGWVSDVIVNQQTGHVVDGHLRVAMAISNRELSVPVVYVDLTEDEEKLVLASLDTLAHMAVTDDEMLAALLNDIKAGDEGLSDLVAGLAAEMGAVLDATDPPGDPGAQLDRAKALREQYGVERGQVWVIGRHRLMCGDSYSEEHRAALLNGATPDMLHTDPPYGINIVNPVDGQSRAAVGGSKPFGGTSGTKRKSGAAFRSAAPTVPVGAGHIVQSNLYPVIEGDDRPFDPAFLMDLAPIVILWGGNYFTDKLPVSSCWICWDKREDITRNNFADGELAWTNMDKPMRIFHHLWNGLHKGSQHGERRTHPTEKPVALFAEIGKMFCPQGIWLDLFAGTGAQIVAAEQVGTTCYAMEWEPLYVATTIQRLVDLGLTPRLAD